MKKYPKIHLSGVLPFIVLFAISFPMAYGLDGRFYSIWDINIPPLDPELQLRRYLTIWDSSAIGGRFFNWASFVPIILEAQVFSLLFDLGWAATLVFWFHYFLTALGIYLLCLYFYGNATSSDEGETTGLKIGSLIAAFAFCNTEYWFLRGHYNINIVFILSGLPFLILYVDKFILSKSLRTSLPNILKAVLATSIMIPGLGNLPVLAFLILFMAIFVLLRILFTNKTIFPRSIPRLLLFLVLSVGVHLWWVAPSMMNPATQEALQREGDYLEDTVKSMRYLTRLRMSEYNKVLSNKSFFVPGEGGGAHSKYTAMAYVHNWTVFRVLGMVPLIVAVFGVIVYRRWGDERAKGALVLFFAMLVIIPMFTLFRPPFGELINWLVLNFPFYVFRRPPTYVFIIGFVTALMLPPAIIWLWKKKRALIPKLSLTIALLLALAINGFPMLLGNERFMSLWNEDQSDVVHVSAAFKLPTFVNEIKEYFDTQPKDEGIVVLPITGELAAYDWRSENGGYFGYGIYSFILEQPTNMNFSYRHQLYFMNKLLHFSQQNNDVDKFLEILRQYNVRHIIITRDALRSPSRSLEFQAEISDQIEFVSRLPIRRYQSFGKHDVIELEISPYPKIRSIDELQRVGDLKVEDYYQLINENGPALVTGEVASVAPIEVSNYEKISQTHYELEVKKRPSDNVPSLLVTPVAYSPLWVASSNGRELKSVKINGFFAGILVPPGLEANPDGRISIEFRLVPQMLIGALQYLALGIVLSAIIILLLPVSLMGSRAHA